MLLLLYLVGKCCMFVEKQSYFLLCPYITSKAALHDAGGLFSFPRWVRQNPKVVNVQRDVWRTSYLICHRVDYSQSQKSSTLLCLPPPDSYCFPKRVRIYYEHQLPEKSPETLLVWTCLRIAAGLNDCDGMRRLQ